MALLTTVPTLGFRFSRAHPTLRSTSCVANAGGALGGDRYSLLPPPPPPPIPTIHLILPALKTPPTSHLPFLSVCCLHSSNNTLKHPSPPRPTPPQTKRTQVLSYHVIQGEADNATLRETLQEFSTLLPNRTLSNSRDGGIIDATGQVANLLAADLQAVNGYVHAIDIVLEPYPLFTQSPTSAPTAAPTATPLLDLMETLEAENLDPTSKYFGQFDTILAALATSELDLELAEPNGPYTVRGGMASLTSKS